MANSEKKEKKNKWLWIVISIFLIEVIIRFLFANYPKSVHTYRDELFLFQLAKSIWNEGSLLVYGVKTDYNKILYPLILSPTFFIKSSLIRIKVITLINSVLVSSSVFPGYLFTKKISNGNSKVIALSLIILAFLPDMCFSTTFMSENLFLPMGLWDFYFLACLLLEKNKKKQITLSVPIGAFTLLLFLVKVGGLLFLVAYCLTCVVLAFKEKSFMSFIRRCAGMIIVFSVLYILFKLVAYHGAGKYYNTGISILSSHYRIEYWLYAAFINILFLLFMWMFFFPILPAISFKRLSEKQKLIYIFLVLCVIINAISVSFAITVPEDLGSIIPRQHMRYYVPMVFPMFVFLLCEIEQRDYSGRTVDFFGNEKKWLYVIAAVFLTAFICLLKERIPYVTVDQNTIRIYNYFFDFHFGDISEGNGNLIINNGIILLKIVMVIWIVIGCLLVYSKHKKIFIYFLMISIIAFELFNTFLSYRDLNEAYKSEKTQIQQAIIIDEFYKSNNGECLVVIPGSGLMGIFDNQILDTYFNSNYCVIDAEQLKVKSEGKEYIDLSDNPFIAVHEKGNRSYKDYKDYSFVISYEEIPFKDDSIKLINLDGVDMVYIYQILTPGRLYVEY